MEAQSFQTVDKFVQDYRSLHPAIKIDLRNARYYCRCHRSTPLNYSLCQINSLKYNPINSSLSRIDSSLQEFD